MASFDRGGDRNYAALPQEEKDRIDFVNWATEQGARREPVGPRRTYAAHAARYLLRMSPDRFRKAVESWKNGRADDVYTALITMAEEAAR